MGRCRSNTNGKVLGMSLAVKRHREGTEKVFFFLNNSFSLSALEELGDGASDTATADGLQRVVAHKNRVQIESVLYPFRYQSLKPGAFKPGSARTAPPGCLWERGGGPPSGQGSATGSDWSILLLYIV